MKSIRKPYKASGLEEIMENINFIAEMKINEFKMMKEEKETLMNT
jgi:hypothetical protein